MHQEELAKIIKSFLEFYENNKFFSFAKCKRATKVYYSNYI
jgi:hypothetical protein